MAILHHHRLLSTALAFLFFATASLLSTELLRPEEVRPESKKGGFGSEFLGQVLSRRRLIGPGSSPPSCRAKCGKCSPCKPVHVPIQPGRSMPLEYYPEAWRCKCGNKLFMP
ncbi:EPIDERMAL PATTERNING FACTOR-like protein 5 [Tasmannia lanceolata]|uniref:EPIDERMAL PATTERNING FACTOR-like protein 5 n=1 Tax=Tasmannia lanceolata TaxID=3420 RepID=UPI004063B337